MPAQPAQTGAEGGHAELLRDSVNDFITRGTDVARARRLRGTDPGYDREVWRQMAGFGWLGILATEEHGGLGLGFAEMRIVLEGLARVLAPEPVCAAAVLAGGVLRHAGTATAAELLTGLVAGDLIPALAWQEQAGVIDAGAVALTARAFEGGYKLGGVKRFVHGAAGADGYIVSARDADGLVLAWVPAGAGGVKLEGMPLADGRSMATLELADVIVPREQVVAAGAVATQALERAIDETLVMTGAELSGVMQRALDMSLDYMRTREQFGKPIGSFQALAHRAVDLYLQRALASAVLDDAIAVLDSDAEPQQRAEIASRVQTRAAIASRDHARAAIASRDRTRAAMASRVKARASEAGLRVTREAIQIHGAIGFTDEYDAGLYLKRAMVLAAWLGNGALHRRRYAQLVPSDL